MKSRITQSLVLGLTLSLGAPLHAGPIGWIGKALNVIGSTVKTFGSTIADNEKTIHTISNSLLKSFAICFKACLSNGPLAATAAVGALSYVYAHYAVWQKCNDIFPVKQNLNKIITKLAKDHKEANPNRALSEETCKSILLDMVIYYNKSNRHKDLRAELCVDTYIPSMKDQNGQLNGALNRCYQENMQNSQTYNYLWNPLAKLATCIPATMLLILGAIAYQ